MALFGTTVPSGLPQVIDQVGAVVEMPKFLPHFTGRQNLTSWPGPRASPPTRVDAAVDTVGLTGRDQDRYRAYSLGMKQRLAIAATLLKDPQLLILDEPTNGLDPAGIREIRETIRTLGESGVTVLLSSTSSPRSSRSAPRPPSSATAACSPPGASRTSSAPARRTASSSTTPTPPAGPSRRVRTTSRTDGHVTARRDARPPPPRSPHPR